MSAHVFTVVVSGRPHNVNVYQESKDVWLAHGLYKNRRIEVKDSSVGGAVKRWREAATAAAPK